MVLLTIPSVSADQNIGMTPVQVVQLDQYTKEAEWGATTVFEFGLFNADTATSYQVNSSASSDRPEFAVTVFPSNFTLGNESFSRLFVNVTALGGAGRVRAVVTLHIRVYGPVSGEETLFATLDAVPKATILDVATSFIAIGCVILIGFSAGWFFERTGVPDILFLIFLGLFLGPVAAQYLGVVLVPPRILSLVTPYVAAFALVMILFDGGLNLKLDAVLQKLGISALHTIVAFILSILAVVVVTHYILGYPLIIGLLLGAMLGGTSGPIIITLVRKMSISEDSKTILVLESVITDVLCIILALALIEFIRGGPGASATDVLTSLAAGFSIAIVVALIFGVVWLRLLTAFSGRPFAYMITIAALLVLYAAVELVGGSGAAAALVFGLVLGNSDEIARMFKIKSGFVLDEKIKEFQMELAFVVRTFFFVFLGLVFTLGVGGSWAVDTELPVLSNFNGTFFLFIIGVVLIFIGLLAVRFLAAAMTSRAHAESRNDRGAIWVMMGRGLAAAVLATVPFTVSSYTSPSDPFYALYRGQMQPYEPQFLNIAFLIILLTVATTTIGVAARERRSRKKPPPSPEELEKMKHREAVERWKRKEKKQYRERIRQKKEWSKEPEKQ